MKRYEEIKNHLWKDSIFQPDDISKTVFLSWDEIFGRDREDWEEWQLKAAQERFDALRPQVRALAGQAESGKVTNINTLNDIVPLLFQHTHYKAYPMSLLEKGRFDLLTKWFDGLTSLDLSGIDAKGCEGIDAWLDLLEKEAPLRIFHTSGTTGKLSFYPRTTMERDFWMVSYFKSWEGFGNDPGVDLGFDGVRLPTVYPSQRYGRYTAQIMIGFFERHIAPTPEQCYTMNNGHLSADLVSLSGRIRVAQAKGELDKMQLSDTMRAKFRQYLDELERRPEETNRFMDKMMHELKGQRVFITSQTSYMAKASEDGLKRGIRNVFAPDSLASIGGGNKGVTLPDNWKEKIAAFTGMKNWRHGYGMTEMTGSYGNCSEGFFHIVPWHIPFLLDPDSGQPLPREGTQTGRFAFLDLLAQTYWGGLVTGDKVTVNWDKPCGCGRKGAYLHDNVTRYSEAVTGDDKVMCSATVDNTDSALQALLAV